MESSNSWRTIRTITTVSLIIAWKMLMKLAMILRKATKRHIQNRKKQTRKSSNLWKSFRQHQSEQAFQSCCNSLCNSWITWQIVVVELFTFFSLALMKDGHGCASIFERMDSTSKGYLFRMDVLRQRYGAVCGDEARGSFFPVWSRCLQIFWKSHPIFSQSTPNASTSTLVWSLGFLQFWHFELKVRFFANYFQISNCWRCAWRYWPRFLWNLSILQNNHALSVSCVCIHFFLSRMYRILRAKMCRGCQKDQNVALFYLDAKTQMERTI